MASSESTTDATFPANAARKPQCSEADAANAGGVHEETGARAALVLAGERFYCAKQVANALASK